MWNVCGSVSKVESIQDSTMMAEAIPRLADSMRSVLSDASVQVLEQNNIEIRFDGLPAWKIDVARTLVNHQYQMFSTSIDLSPLCLATMSLEDLQRLATVENLGLRGATVLPIDPALNDGRGAIRIRASYIGQKGRSTDEVENLTIDILNVLAFTRILEDRLTDSSIAGDFSFELYNSRFGPHAIVPPSRFVSNGQVLFQGSTERVFGEISKSLKSDLGFQVRNAGNKTAIVVAPATKTDSPIEIVIRIPDEIPVFVAHAPLMKISGKSQIEIAALLDELNAQGEAGHFEFNPADQVLFFAAWKHLTNDLRHFSFDHTILSVNRAYALATENLLVAPVQAGGGIVLSFPAFTVTTNRQATGIKKIAA
jgi:hypothetical protein